VTPANNQTLNYDNLDRLSSGTGGFNTGSITYDSNSNRLTYGSTNFTYATTSNRMTVSGSSSIGYTATGNTTTFGTTATASYNKANQMSQIVIGANTSVLKYDAFGHRLQTTVNAGTPGVVEYDLGGSLLTETNSGTKTDYAWLDNVPLYVIQPAAATMSALHTDKIGTVQKATDATKTVVWSGNYNPYGGVTPTTSITMHLRFPGHQSQSFFYDLNGFRNYLLSPSTRYMEVDPTGLAGGLNPYIYALNNPYKFIDPLGLDTQYSIGIGFTGALTFGIGGGVSAGVSVPDSPANIFGYQAFVSGQANALVGVGVFGGYGLSLQKSSSAGPLPFLSGQINPYEEVDVGDGPFSLGGSISLGPQP
jgi:RHS repeat-associated protein